MLTMSERNWAVAAHLSALITVLAAWFTGGAGAVLALLIPFGLYVYFRERAPHVAFHALQATVFQSLIAIVWVLSLGLLIVTWIVTGVLSLALIGLLMLPLALGVTLLIALVLIGLPLAGAAYVCRGAYLAYRGERFEYPVVGRLVAQTMALT